MRKLLGGLGYWYSSIQNAKQMSESGEEYRKYFAKTSVYLQRDQFLFNPRLEDTEEIISPESEQAAKIEQLASLLSKSKYSVCLTGAGISTASGIADYRSGSNTILKTGPGKWELEENKKKYIEVNGTPKRIQAINANPSPTSLAISKLYANNMIKSIITQNVDNLHYQSHIPRKSITELHGNIISEKCDTCGTTHYRDYYTRQKHLKWGDHHLTGRECQRNGCKGLLHDTLVFFGESIDKSLKDQAQEEVEKADLLIVVGTSLTVQSAARLVWLAEKKGTQIVIINLQRTKHDQKALTIHGVSESIFENLLSKLGLKADPFSIIRNVELRFQKIGYSDYDFSVNCTGFDGLDLSAIKQVNLQHSDENGQSYQKSISGDYLNFKAVNSYGIDKIQLEFYGNIGEPTEFQVPEEALEKGNLFSMSAPGALNFLNLHLEYLPGQEGSTNWSSSYSSQSYK